MIDKSKLDPSKEGVDHINIYSQSNLYLGRFMSNFYPSPVQSKGVVFTSVEHWWWFQVTGHSSCLDSSKKAYIIKKEMSEWLKHNKAVGEIDRAALKKLLKQKMMDFSKGVLINFIVSELPFTHYYVYSGKIVHAREQFLVGIWEEIRTELKNELNALFNYGMMTHSNISKGWYNAWYNARRDPNYVPNSEINPVVEKLNFEDALKKALYQKISVDLDDALNE